MMKKFMLLNRDKSSQWFASCVGTLVALGMISLSGCAPTPPTAVVEDAPAAFQSSWAQIPGWENDRHAAALEAFKRSCTSLKYRDGWAEVCARAATVADDSDAACIFFEQHFTPGSFRTLMGAGRGL